MPSATEQSGRVPLPIELTTFIGRKRETAELCRLIASTRLLTLTGAGGSGKTRLAREVAKRASAALQVEFAWVELASLDDPGHIPQQIAAACGVTEEMRGGAAGLIQLLTGRNLLIVLDNCEHLVDACAEIVELLLRSCPELRILATSREALGVKGERAWLIPALPMTEAMQLFLDRARDAAGQFEITEQNRPVIEEICTRLDGIPLAIELAAARMKVLTPEQVRERLHQSFRLLKSTARSTIPRHRTLTAAIDWSYDLLPDDERTLFRRLAAFRGGFTLDAVEAVGGSAATGAADVLDSLAGLVDRSLVAVREQQAVARYTMLETVLQYARLKLVESGEEAEIRSRHARYVERIVSEAEPHLIRTERPAWIERLLPELENIRDALAWSRTGDPALHVRLAGSLWWFWFSTRYWSEAARVYADALALPDAASASRERARLLFATGALAALQARPTEARPPLEEAIALADACADAQLSAYARNYLGMTYAGEARPETRAHCEAAAAWFEAHDDLYGLRLALLLLATASFGQGAYDEAIELSGRAVEIARAFKSNRELAIALHTHSLSFIARGDFERARPLLLESLAASRVDPAYFMVAATLECLAEVVGREGRPLEAARILGAAEHTRSMVGAARFKYAEQRLLVAVPLFREAAGNDAFERSWREGNRLSPEAIIDELITQPQRIELSIAAREAPARALLRVRALGPLELEIDGETVAPEAWAYGKPKELLVYLLLQPAGTSRDRIARALWPSATPTQLKNNFHVTLHHLRKALGHPEWIVVEQNRYRLARDLAYEFDADQFTSAARHELNGAQPGAGRIDRLRSVLSLYRGELLEGEAVGDWLEDHSSPLRRLWLDAALALGAELEQTNQVTAAIETYQQLIARDELQEEPHRRLLACWTRSGERPRALRHYERLAAMLRETLDAEPEAETTALYSRVLAGQDV